MKNILNLAILLISMIACNQNKEYKMKQNPNISAENIVEEITKQVKHYPLEPRFYIKINNTACFSEILINDIIAFQNFNDKTFSTGQEISHLIFKSGPQKVTCRLYNIGLWENKHYEYIEERAELEINVEMQDNINPDNVELLATNISPKNNNGDFIGPNSSFYEYNFVFIAKTPNESNLFDNVVDLKQTQSKELKNNLLNEYNKLKFILESKDINSLSKIYYNSLKHQYISEYADKKTIENGWMEILDIVKNKTLEVQTIKDYKMEFYANGKLVRFVNTTNDPNLRGKSALWSKYKKDDEMSGYLFGLYFYIPKGKTEFEVY
jgi:hypothetical protein